MIIRPTLLLILFSGVFQLWLAIYAFSFRNRSRAVLYYSVVFFLCGIYSLFYGAELLLPSFDEKMFFFYLRSLPLMFVSFFWLCTVVEITGHRRWFHPPAALFLFAFASAMVFALLHPEIRPYYRHSFALAGSDPAVLVWKNGPLFWLDFAMINFYMFATNGLILWSLVRSTKKMRLLFAALLLASLLPYASNFAFVMLGKSHQAHINFLPIALLISGLLFYFVLSRQMFFSLLPFTRWQLANALRNPIFVASSTRQFLDCNDAAKEAMRLDRAPADFADLPPEWRPLFDRPVRSQESFEWTLACGAEKKIYSVDLFPLYDKENLSCVLYLLDDVTDLSTANAKLAQNELVLREHLRRMALRHLTVREEVERRISHEMHDEIGQHLTATLLLLQSISSPGTTSDTGELLQKAVASLERAIAASRKICSNLRPPILDQQGIEDPLEWLVRDFESYSGRPATYDCASEWDGVGDSIRTCFFRVLQESLTNIARHSGATRAQIEIYDEDDRIVMLVKDDGRGIPDAAFAPGSTKLGIRGMQERAFACGGDCKIEKLPEGGTRVTLNLPRAG